jgi:hypothetical protein
LGVGPVLAGVAPAGARLDGQYGGTGREEAVGATDGSPAGGGPAGPVAAPEAMASGGANRSLAQDRTGSLASSSGQSDSTAAGAWLAGGTGETGGAAGAGPRGGALGAAGTGIGGHVGRSIGCAPPAGWVLVLSVAAPGYQDGEGAGADGCGAAEPANGWCDGGGGSNRPFPPATESVHRGSSADHPYRPSLGSTGRSVTDVRIVRYRPNRQIRGS